MTNCIRIIRHEGVKDSGGPVSGRPRGYLTSEQALEQAKAFARAERA
jgi:hypothetical protein